MDNNTEEQYSPLETYEIIEDEFAEAPAGDTEGTPSVNYDFDLADFVSKEIGANEGKILTGSPDEPIEYSLSELTPKQQVAILKDFYSRQSTQPVETPEFTDDEMFVINTLREGKLDELYQQLGQELGVEQQQSFSNPSDEQLIAWKIKSEIPDISDEELEYEIEQFNSSSLRDKRLEGIKQQYNQLVEQQQTLQQQQQQAQQQAQIEELQRQITEVALSTDDLFDFELNDDIKNDALASLLEPDEETGNPQLIDFLGTPEGLAQTAMLWRAMPEINEYVNSLHQEIDRLKSNQEKVLNNKTVVDQSDVNMLEDEDLFGDVPDLKTI